MRALTVTFLIDQLLFTWLLLWNSGNREGQKYFWSYGGEASPFNKKKTSEKFRDFVEQYIRSVLTIWTYDLLPYKITLLNS